MMTHSATQQAVRHMTAAQKREMMAARIAADTAERQAREARRREIERLWHDAEAAGLSAADLHALDMALMSGANVADLRKMIDCYPAA